MLALIKSNKTGGASVTPPAGTSLEAALAAPSSEQRRQAARQLAGNPGAAPLLARHLSNEPDATVREVILTSLMSVDNEAAAAGLIPLLRSDNAVLRNEAIQALQHMPTAAVQHIEALLQDDDSDVRIFAINVLGALAHPRSQDWLIQLIQSDPNINVCTTAVDLLAELGTQEAVPSLQALEHRFDHPFLHFAVATAIRRISE